MVSSIHRNSQSLLSRIKSTNYLESIIARQEARMAGFDEALFFNEKGFLTEASMSNVFLVTKGVLRTPRLASGVLPGITRETVLQLTIQLGLYNIESDINLDELYQAEEAFLTNSLIEIMPLTNVNGGAIGLGKPGTITERLMEAYRGIVKKIE